MIWRKVTKLVWVPAILILSISMMPDHAWAQDGQEDDPSDMPAQNSSAGGSLLETSGAKFLGSLFGAKEAGTKTEVTSPTAGPDINQVTEEAYDGPKARIAVARFVDKTGSGWYDGKFGDGMADQLTTALFNSGRFILLERQLLSEVLQEQDLGASGRVRASTAARMGEIEGAELLITGAVTEFMNSASGGGGSAQGGAASGLALSRGVGGFGVLGLAAALVGGLAAGHSSAHMAIDIRVIDTRTSRVVAATSVRGSATNMNMSAALLGAAGGGALGVSLSSWKNTPIEKALRQCIKQAVAFIASKTPKNYYRHGATVLASISPGAGAKRSNPAPVKPRQSPNYLPGMVARVSSSRLNVRQGPSTSHPVVFGLAQGDPILILQKHKDWIQIRDRSQRTGWTAAWLTYPDKSVSPEMFEATTTSETEKAAAVPSSPVIRAATVSPTTAAAAAALPPPSEKVAPAVPSAPKTAAKSSDGGRGKGDPITRLKKLKAIFEQGIITKDEYNTLRDKILEDL
jgi:curli biogenesis system outer membrane secretion channel CsgG/SH3-like domain-containing protein